MYEKFQHHDIGALVLVQAGTSNQSGWPGGSLSAKCGQEGRLIRSGDEVLPDITFKQHNI